MRDVFTLVLKRPDSVTTAANAEEALERLRGETFDVVISDQRMPGMSGTALLARARELAPRSARVILTGYPTDHDVQAALKAGVVEAVLPKPWKSKELEKAIESLLSRRAN